MIGGYTSPLSVVNAFLFKSEVSKFLESVIEDVALLNVNNTAEDFIPPIVYNEMGKCFNVDYNFLIHSLSYFTGEDGIKNDFMMVDGMDSGVIKNAKFLVAGIFEEYYGLVRINPVTLDMGKFRNKSQKVDISTVFYNVICIKNGSNVKRFSAVPFSASAMKNLVSEDSFYALMNIAKNSVFEQVIFENHAYEKYILEHVKPSQVWS